MNVRGARGWQRAPIAKSTSAAIASRLHDRLSPRALSINDVVRPQSWDKSRSMRMCSFGSFFWEWLEGRQGETWTWRGVRERLQWGCPWTMGSST